MWTLPYSVQSSCQVRQNWAYKTKQRKRCRWTREKTGDDQFTSTQNNSSTYFSFKYCILPPTTEWFLVPFIQEYNLLYLPWKLNWILLQSCCLKWRKDFQEIKHTGVDFLSLPYFESVRHFRWRICNTPKKFLYTKLCYTISGAIKSITLLHYLGVNPEMGNLRKYFSKCCANTYMVWLWSFSSEEATKITLCSEYLLFGEARKRYM